MDDEMDGGAMPSGGPERGVAAVGTVAGLSALVSSAACCVLPLALASAGIGAGTLAAVVPYRWPLTIAAAAAIAIGWALYLRQRRMCAAGADCARPARATLVLLCAASVMTALSASWKLFEQPLMRAFGG